MKDIKINVDDIDFTKPKKFYCKVYGLSENAIRNRFKRLGILHKFTTGRGDNMKILTKELQEQYKQTPKLCNFCNKIIPYKKREQNSCSQRCARLFYIKTTPFEDRRMSQKQKEILSLKAKEHARNFPSIKETISLECKFCKKPFNVSKHDQNKRKFCSRICSDRGADRSNCGGFRGNSGNRGKYGWYKGYYCQSSWELAWVIYSLDHNIKFTRNTKGFEYLFENKLHKFHPDFYLLESKIYLEIKGRVKDDDKEKIKQFQGSLIVLFKEQMTPILQYVIQKYGKDFIELYEGNPHKVKKNDCLLCGKPAKYQYCSRQCGCCAAQKIYMKEHKKS